MEKQKKKGKKQELKQKERISEKLIKDCKSLWKKYYDKSRVNLMFFYWELGKRVNQEYGEPLIDSAETIKSKGQGIKNDDSITSIVENLREQGITITRYDLCQARRFAIEYENLKELIEEENMSWNKVRKTMSEKFKEKKELTEKSPFNKLVLNKFRKWNSFVNDFYKAMQEIDFTVANEDEKDSIVEVLDNNIKKMQKRREQILNGEL